MDKVLTFINRIYITIKQFVLDEFHKKPYDAPRGYRNYFQPSIKVISSRF